MKMMGKLKNYIHTHEKTEKIYANYIVFKKKFNLENCKTILRRITNYPLKIKKTPISVSEARNNLMNFHARPEVCTGISKNEIAETICDLQIIIPCYNVEKYVKKCLESVLSQKTSFSFHIIAINDGSTDNTREILEEYNDSPLVTVLNIENGGSSAARNAGLKKLFGKYIMFIDGDDFLLDGAIENLMKPAVLNDYDIVQGGFYAAIDGKLIPYNIRYEKNAIVNENKLMGYPWGKVFKRELWETFCFPLGLRHQDTVNSFLVFPNSKKSFAISDAVYGYTQNSSGVTKSAFKKKWSIDTYWITEVLDSDRQKLKYKNNKTYYLKVLEQFKLNFNRTVNVSEDIKKSIFLLEAELFRKNFPIMLSLKGFWLALALYLKDFKKYLYYFEK